MKTSLKEKLQLTLYGILAILLFCGLIYFQIGIWNECRETNSFWYCMRVLSK